MYSSTSTKSRVPIHEREISMVDESDFKNIGDKSRKRLYATLLDDIEDDDSEDQRERSFKSGLSVGGKFGLNLGFDTARKTFTSSSSTSAAAEKRLYLFGKSGSSLKSYEGGIQFTFLFAVLFLFLFCRLKLTHFISFSHHDKSFKS
jgi:hypothetical protein